ncbi:MAG: hypothetical protein EPO57_07035 [Chitinophagaceae bacterium]|nr:MAG: hypothetical protein EPO57_07035 [Chitinophagaceae bacterium]
MKKILILFAFFALTENLKAQDSLQQYAGKYIIAQEDSPVPEIEVVVLDGNLMMQSQVGASNLTKLGVDSFLLVEFNGSAVFKRNDSGAIVAVHIRAMEYFLIGQKQATDPKLTMAAAHIFNRELYSKNKYQNR